MLINSIVLVGVILLVGFLSFVIGAVLTDLYWTRLITDVNREKGYKQRSDILKKYVKEEENKNESKSNG
jgi:hypothetical protein